MSKRILLAIDSLRVGGLERQTLALIQGLRRRGRFQVVLALLDRGGAFDDEAMQAAISVLPVRRRFRFDPSPALSLIEQTRPAEVGLMHAVGWMSALATMPAARRLSIPLLNGSIRGAPPALGLRERLSRACAVRSDAIVANSQAALQAYGLDGDARACVIANGIDVRRFERTQTVRETSPTICMVANFNSLKDHASVIRALPIVQRQVAGVQLVLVGQDGGTLRESRALVQQQGVERSVRFITDRGHPEAFIAGSDVCVLASPSESFSNAILEYMAAARPIVATDTCGDTATLIRKAGCGLLVPLGSPPVLAAALIELLGDAQRAQQMGDAARQAVAPFTIERMVGEYEILYERLMGAEAHHL